MPPDALPIEPPLQQSFLQLCRIGARGFEGQDARQGHCLDLSQVLSLSTRPASAQPQTDLEPNRLDADAAPDQAQRRRGGVRERDRLRRLRRGGGDRLRRRRGDLDLGQARASTRDASAPLALPSYELCHTGTLGSTFT